MTHPRRARLALLAAALPFALVACGEDPAEPASSATTGASADAAGGAFPVTIETAAGPVELAEQPERIVSLSATATEMLFAIGAGDTVVAADMYSNYPPEAPTTDLSEIEPNVEAIVGYDPDLVVASIDLGGLVDGLNEVGVPTVILSSAATLDDSYTQLEQLGAVTGNIGEAAELVGRMQADIEELVAQVPADSEPLTYFHELDPGLYSVTSDTFLGEIYGLAGMTSIADQAPEAGGFPQLSPEFVVVEDPDLIFFADGGVGGVTAEAIAARPGWEQLTAVRQGHVVEVDPDIASRWGPRVVDYLRMVIDARSALEPAR